MCQQVAQLAIQQQQQVFICIPSFKWYFTNSRKRREKKVINIIRIRVITNMSCRFSLRCACRIVCHQTNGILTLLIMTK